METQGLGCILGVWVVFLNLLHIGQICHDCDLLHSVAHTEFVGKPIMACNHACNMANNAALVLGRTIDL